MTVKRRISDDFAVFSAQTDDFRQMSDDIGFFVDDIFFFQGKFPFVFRFDFPVLHISDDAAGIVADKADQIHVPHETGRIRMKLAVFNHGRFPFPEHGIKLPRFRNEAVISAFFPPDPYDAPAQMPFPFAPVIRNDARVIGDA